ncbi:MAG: RNA polymerase sigma factor [Acidovorax sp.]
MLQNMMHHRSSLGAWVVMDGRHFVDCMVRGDVSVWDELLPELRRIALGACHNLRVYDEIKEDIVQDVALKVFTDWRSYQHESQLNTWIYAIARHRCIDALRKRVVRGDDKLPVMEISTEQVDTRALYRPSLEQALCVEQMIAALESQGEARKGSMRMIDVVRWWVMNDGSSNDDLARFLGTTPGAAKTRKSAILKRIRELCQEFCGDAECLVSASV